MTGQEEVELARINYARDSHRWETGCGVVRTGLRVLFGITVAICSYKALESVAGTTTVFKAVVDAALNLSADRWVAYVFGASGVGGYAIERRNKQRAIEGMKKEIDALRDLINKNRGRSGLNPRGKLSKKELKND